MTDDPRAAKRKMRYRLHWASGQRWQPIETAPKDDGGPRCHFLVWTPDNLCTALVIADGSGWRHAYSGNELTNIPTHWMPLPAPPADPQEPK